MDTFANVHLRRPVLLIDAEQRQFYAAAERFLLRLPLRVVVVESNTGLCKKVGARLQEKFSPATASPGRPCQAGA